MFATECHALSGCNNHSSLDRCCCLFHRPPRHVEVGSFQCWTCRETPSSSCSPHTGPNRPSLLIWRRVARARGPPLQLLQSLLAFPAAEVAAGVPGGSGGAAWCQGEWKMMRRKRMMKWVLTSSDWGWVCWDTVGWACLCSIQLNRLIRTRCLMQKDALGSS